MWTPQWYSRRYPFVPNSDWSRAGDPVAGASELCCHTRTYTGAKSHSVGPVLCHPCRVQPSLSPPRFLDIRCTTSLLVKVHRPQTLKIFLHVSSSRRPWCSMSSRDLGPALTK